MKWAIDTKMGKEPENGPKKNNAKKLSSVDPRSGVVNNRLQGIFTAVDNNETNSISKGEMVFHLVPRDMPPKTGGGGRTPVH